MTTPTPSANGRAFQAYLEGAQAALDGITVIAYYQQPLPSALDEQLAAIAGAFTALPVALRERFMAALSARERSLLGVFGHRAATLAVRGGDPERLRLGLIGNAIANFAIPEKRDSARALAVFYHCARKLDLEPATVFDEAAAFAGEEMAGRMRAFGRREDVTLGQFGWREVRTDEGLRYTFEWR